jgi:hypothetical protein
VSQLQDGAISWASRPLNADPVAVVNALEMAITVDLIATFEPELACCNLTDTLDHVVSDPAFKDFDYLPVRQDNRIVGLLLLHKFREPGRPLIGRTAEGEMWRLDQSILIASGSGILGYIGEADQNPCRLVVRGTRIEGIITISDLQKLPVRPALFLLITHLELLMAEVIRNHFHGRPDEEWLALLKTRRERVEKEWKDLTSQNLEIDQITATNFCDKRIVLYESGLLGCSRTRAEKEFGAIEKLRNRLAHASDYASRREEAQKTVSTVKLARRWIEEFRAVTTRSAGGGV